MHEIEFASLAGLAGLAFTVATCAVIAAMLYVERRAAGGALPFDPHAAQPAVFLFDEGLLVDLTDRASRLLDRCPPGEAPWTRVLAHLAGGFPGIVAALGALAQGDRIEREGEAGGQPLRLEAERWNGMLRLTLTDLSAPEARLEVEARRLHELERDARLLGTIGARAPCATWTTRVTTAGERVTWANAAYIALVTEARDAEAAATWPLPVLFDTETLESGDQRKISLKVRGTDEPRWFQIVTADADGERVHFASPRDATVKAERAMREVVQTLAKTFAHLPIGLAIFSRDRRLVLFNPALTDLSGLSAAFLGDRPTLSAVLDEMRNRRFIAEPKNYKSWRQMITQLEAEAERGTYAETWSLPDGRTFRVTGRPHPGGAIAFLFEDITDEITLTRRFRKDTQLGQAILDELPLALAVFARDGTMTMANAAYAGLWDIDPGATLGVVGIVDSARRWVARSVPTPVWGDVRDFVTLLSERSEWSGEIEMLDGRSFDLRCSPLPGGDSLIVFSERPVRPGAAAGVPAKWEARSV